MKTGIVLIAVRNSYYIKAAYNLCLSLQAQNRSVPVTLVTDGVYDHLFDTQKFFFSKVIRIKDANPFHLKTHLYHLSPYDATLFLDSDMIFNPAQSLDKLIESLQDVDFTMANRGPVGADYDWCDAQAFKKECGGITPYNLSSEVIWFKKNDEVKELFAVASNFYACNTIIQRRIGGYQPDEPSFAYAMTVAGIIPHLSPWHPSYWVANNRGKFTADREIQNNFYLLSMGGSYIDKRIVDLYGRYAKIAANKMGAEPLPYTQKRALVKDRHNI